MLQQRKRRLFSSKEMMLLVSLLLVIYDFSELVIISNYIDNGRVEVLVDNKPRKQLGPGNGFGDLALLYNAPRSATITAQEKTYLFGIDRNTFKLVVEGMMTAQYKENRKFINEAKFFGIYKLALRKNIVIIIFKITIDALTEDQKDSLASSMISLRFKQSENILDEGDLASSFYIIQEGTVIVFKDGKEIRKLTKGDYFGEQAFHYHTVRSATVKALTDVNRFCTFFYYKRALSVDALLSLVTRLSKRLDQILK